MAVHSLQALCDIPYPGLAKVIFRHFSYKSLSQTELQWSEATCTDKENLQVFFLINMLPIRVDHETIYIAIIQNLAILIYVSV